MRRSFEAMNTGSDHLRDHMHMIVRVPVLTVPAFSAQGGWGYAGGRPCWRLASAAPSATSGTSGTKNDR